MSVNAKVIWKEENIEENKLIYGLEFVLLSEEKQDILKETFILNTNFFIEHANIIVESMDNLQYKNEVIQFFVYDLKDTVDKLLAIEKVVENDTSLDESMYNRIAHILDGLLIKGDALVNKISDNKIEQKIKQRVRAILGRFLYQSAIVKRALEKPKGYPGDYDMLEQVYNNIEISNNSFAKYIDRIFLNTPYADAIRGRKNLTREVIKKSLLEYQHDINVLNLASGSLRELRELFADFTPSIKSVFNCLDQDVDSLNFSKQELLKINPSNVAFNFLQENILHLEKINFENESVDILYSIGIADYLQDRMLTKIIKDSFDFLKVQGEMLFAYKDRTKHKPILLNWFCDWNFIPRNEKEFLKLIDKALEGNKYKLEVVRETETGIIFFAVITKL